MNNTSLHNSRQGAYRGRRPGRTLRQLTQPRLLLEPLEDRLVLSSGIPHLVTDINVNPVSSNPLELVVMNGAVYFAADDGLHGVELWKSNGTAAGTTLFKDINPGRNGSLPRSL